MTEYAPAILLRRFNSLFLRAGFPRNWFLIPLAAFIGITAGLAAIGYGWLVRSSTEFFYGEIAGRNLSGRHIWFILALPAVGGLLVGIIKVTCKLPLISHGIPDVMEALARRGGRLTARSGFFVAVNSAITLGSGGATGQEGPIIHIGSVIGSVIGQLLGATREHMDTLVGCGAAAGLAAIFKAPIAGVLLVLEVMLRDFSSRTLMPIVIASVFGVVTVQNVNPLFHLGPDDNSALFSMPANALTFTFTYAEVLPYFVLGIGCGIAGWLFSKLISATEKAWHHAPLKPAIKPMAGGLILGVTGILFFMAWGKVHLNYEAPPFFGNGYEILKSFLNPRSYDGSNPKLIPGFHLALLFLLVIALAKMIGTSFTLGSGGSGGTFAPSLFVGAALGGAFGVALQKTGWFPDVGPAGYALAGMAGVLSASVHCPLTAFVLVFEITGNYNIILPVMLVTITATVISQFFSRDSLYTAALREMGVRVSTLSDLHQLRRVEVATVALSPAVLVKPDESAERLLELSRASGVRDFVVTKPDGKYAGMVLAQDLRPALLEPASMALLVVADIMRADVPAVRPSDTLDLVFEIFVHHDTATLAVLADDQKVLGTIARSSLTHHYREALNPT